ncbi:MAG: TetR/AcrR family transcriptional regulator [Candidatus Nanopelagicaceae bacterium]
MGRPRDTSKEVSIEGASIELLCELGYERISIEAIALRAHVGKGTIYRRWKNKAELIADALHHYSFSEDPTIDTGSLRGDLIETISEKVKAMKSTDGQLIAGLMVAARADSVLAAAIAQSMIEGAGVTHAAIFERAVAREDLSSSVQSTRILELISAVIYFRLFVYHQSVNSKFIELFVDEVLIPVLHPIKT